MCDLAVTRFWGRLAPERPGADAIAREAYSLEVISAGFWPGGGDVKGPAFYSYTVPEPSGYSTWAIRPEAAFYHPQMKEFILTYDDVCRAQSPREPLLDFLQSAYEAGATLAHSAKMSRREETQRPSGSFPLRNLAALRLCVRFLGIQACRTRLIGTRSSKPGTSCRGFLPNKIR